MLTEVSIDLSRCREALFSHQVVGVHKLLTHPAFGLFDSMGLGKTATVIVAAQILFERGIIDQVLVLAPATVRGVWVHPELGELRKHLWEGLPAVVTEYHARTKTWYHGDQTAARRLRWVVSNYDYVRNPDRLKTLAKWCSPRTLLVLDESSAIKNRTAKQTKAAYILRANCGRIVLMNGTPISHSPLDMFSQGNIISGKILDCRSFYLFRARYAVMAQNVSFPKILAWQHLDDLQKRFAPWVLRRTKEDCLDLPPKLDPVIRTVPLSPATWRLYREMRDDLVTWLDTESVSAASLVLTKIIRLAQITSGYIGGVEVGMSVDSQTRAVGQEKLDDLLAWMDDLLDDDPSLKLLIWCRFKPELQRAHAMISKKYPAIPVGTITGGQSSKDREAAVSLLDPRTAPKGPAVVIASAGHRGLNLTACHTVVYLSHDYSLDERLQSKDRVHRIGQEYPVSYYDYVATGPNGQRTIDEIILAALQKRDDIARWTTDAWRIALTEE